MVCGEHVNGLRRTLSRVLSGQQTRAHQLVSSGRCTRTQTLSLVLSSDLGRFGSYFKRNVTHISGSGSLESQAISWIGGRGIVVRFSQWEHDS